MKQKIIFTLVQISIIFSGSFSFSQNITQEEKYCSNPGLCDNPITMGGMVTSPNHLASQAGLEILQQGGNVVDAAIAVSSVLAVVYPQMTTLGGDNFWLIYNAKTGEIKALNASGRSGEKATIDFYKKKGFQKIPPRGYLSANTVPGVVSGWDEAYQYAKASMSNQIKWENLFTKAINYAEKGFPVTHSLEYWSTVNTDVKDQEFRNLQRFQKFNDIFLKSSGEPYKTGEILKQPQLAHSFKLIAKEGADAFYKGTIAQSIVKDLKENGGLLTLTDFKNHKADWVDPISVTYREYQAYNFPPNTQGFASLEILNILNNYDVKSLGEGTADYYHLLVEATKQAFVDRDKYLTDPDFASIPLDFLLSKQHGKDQAAQINRKEAGKNIQPLDPKGDTVWLGIVDEEGNAVSLIQSVYYDFGSGIVGGDTGIILQNRGSFFSLDPKNVNHLEPKKRTFHTLNPAMLLKEGKPYLIYGTMGGEGQPQTQAAIVTRVVDFGMSPQQAIHAPRWLYGRTWGASSNDLKIEGRIDEAVIEELKKRGHPIKVVADYTDTMGHAGAILVNPEKNIRQGGTDPRGDGVAIGY